MKLISSNTLLRGGRYLRHLACLCLLTTTLVSGGWAQNALPTPWQSAPIGEVVPAGAASIAGDTFTLSAAGADIQDVADAFRFVDQSVTGNVTITAHAVSMTNPNGWAKAGVMIRNGQGADAKNVFLAVTPGHGVTFQHRDATGVGTATDAVSETAAAPLWLRLRRVGPQVSGYTSMDGKRWTPVGTATLPLAATVDVGLALTSHQDGTLGSAVFDHVTVTQDKAADVAALPLNVTVSAVDPHTFHVVTVPPGNAAPPVSPYVVQATSLSRADGRAQVKTPQGTLDTQGDGRLRLSDKSGRALLPTVTVTESGDTITLTLHHDPHERLYGTGNQGMNRAGDLTHPEGTQTVGNGVTRVPFLWSTGGWSIFVANDRTGSAWQDENGTLTWTMPGPDLDLYLGVAPDGYGLLDAYSRLTGRAPIPPRWAFGFMLSRWGYADAADVQDKWQQFRDRQIPVDAFIYDYDWFVNDWEFNPKTFPAGSIDKMHQMGLKFVGIRKPRVNGENLEYARRQGWTLSSPLGIDLHFDIPAARYWWWLHHVPLVQAGADGWWNDEAEQTSDEFFQMTQTQWEGERAMTPRRTWTISRAFAPGMQRFGAAVWTGDINSDWSTLANQPGTMLNWSLAGMPYVGQDIGGFQGTPTPELYARWIEEGVFVPVMRAHGTLGSPRWPWAFGDDVLAATKKAIELRYRLIPYFYTFAAQTAATGRPWMRPLVLEFPQDPKTFNLEDEWLVGDRLLAAPVLTEGGARDIYLPVGKWYDFNTGAPVAGGQTLHVQAPLDVIPAYVRAGTILPLGPVLQSTALGAEDPLEIRVYPGANADFALYEDDGNTYSYEKGASSRIPMHWDDKHRTLTVAERAGSYPGMLATQHLIIVLPDGTRKTATYTGHTVRVGF